MATATAHRSWDATTATRSAGIGALLAAKAADLSLTATVLAVAPGAEVNPIAAFAYTEAGAAGLFALALAIVAIVVGVTEFGTILAGHVDGPLWAAPAIHLLGYGVPAIVWTVAAAHNARLLAGVLA